MRDLTKKHNGKLIRQILPFLYTVILCTTIICGVFFYFFSIDIMLNFQRNEYDLLMKSIAEEMNSYGHLSWYIDYWKDNSDSLDIIYDDKEDLAVEIYAREDMLSQAYGDKYGISIYDVIEQQVEVDGGNIVIYEDYSLLNPAELDGDVQKYLAEYVYLCILNRYNDIKSGSNMKYLYCLSQVNGDDMMFLFSGKRNGEVFGDTGEDIYRLGKVNTISREKFPTLFATYETGKIIGGEAIFHSDRSPRDRYNFYYPICDENGKTMCLIGAGGKFANISVLMYRPYIAILVTYICAMMICALIVASILRRRAIDPINHIQESIKKYGENRDSDELRRDMGKILANNEIGLLSEDLSEMGDELTQYIDDVTKMTMEKQRLNTELDLAQKIQKASLRTDFDNFPDKWKIRLFGSMNPAKEVGGDFYDFMPLDDDHMAFIIGDVSGKGIPASLYMMICIVVFRNECKYSKEPEKVMEAVNRALCYNNNENMFVTAWLGILEISTGIVRMANAGHENPVIRRADGTVEELKDKHGFVLAGMEDSKYARSECILNSGDMLMVYTDGAAEAINPNNEQYGVERLKRLLEKKECDCPEQYVDAVLEDITSFVNGAQQFDDTTMLAICYDNNH